MTATSSFGAGKRESHDSSVFYKRRLFEAEINKSSTKEINLVQSSHLNRIFCKSSENMSELPDSSIALMITSPPYNVGKDYDLDLTLEEYLAFLKRVLNETARVLIPGGRIALNVANLGRKPYIPLNAYIVRLASSLGLLMRGEIIWIKGQGATGSCAWGSWMSAGNPTLRDLHEYILIFSNGRLDRPVKGKSTIDREEFMAATTSVWNIKPESAKRVGHPAPFPVALVSRLINLYSFEGDVILDPFMGSGTTAIAAIESARNFVGYETNPEYVEMAYRRVETRVASCDGTQPITRAS
jgi:modification methylase